MWAHILFIGCGVALALAGWYGCFVRRNRARGRQAIFWLQGAIADYGRISSVVWISSAHLCARLNLTGDAFRQPFLDLRLAPRHNPLRWLLWRCQGKQETLTFQANLACPPGDNLQVGRLRWNAFDHRPLPQPDTVHAYPVATLFISTQPTCRPQLTGRINGVVATRNYDTLAVSFRPHPPHFSVTFSLQETLRHPAGELPIFESLRELAQGSPTSRM